MGSTVLRDEFTVDEGQKGAVTILTNPALASFTRFYDALLSTKKACDLAAVQFLVKIASFIFAPLRMRFSPPVARYHPFVRLSTDGKNS